MRGLSVGVLLVVTTLLFGWPTSDAVHAADYVFPFDGGRVFFGNDDDGVAANLDHVRDAFLAALIPETVSVQDFDDVPEATVPTTPPGTIVDFPGRDATVEIVSLANEWTQIRGYHSPDLYPISEPHFLVSSILGASHHHFFTLDFSSPQYAFGFYGRDIDEVTVTTAGNRDAVELRYVNATQPAPLDDILLHKLDILQDMEGLAPADGNAVFWGVISETEFNRIKFTTPHGGSEAIGIDDMIIGQPIPEPSTLILSCVLAGIGIAYARYRRRRS